MIKKGLGVFFVLCCVLMAYGCSKKAAEGISETPDISQDKVETSGEIAASPASGQTKEDSMVVATVNGREITGKEVDQALENFLMQNRQRIPPDQMEQAKISLRKQAVENLINQSLLIQEADQQGIEPGKEAVDARFNEITQRMPNPEEFQKVLSSMGMSEEEFRQELGQNLKIETLMEANMADIKEVTDEESAAFYREHPENFRVPEKVRASHILLSSEGDSTPEGRTQARLELSRLRGEIEKGADFGEMAGQYSDCPSKSRGGDLGFFERGQMVKEFEEAAFSMKKGEVSDIVETQFGCHLIKKTDHQEANVVPLDQARDKIVTYLGGQRKEEAMGEYLTKLRDVAKIEYTEVQ